MVRFEIILTAKAARAADCAGAPSKTTKTTR